MLTGQKIKKEIHKGRIHFSPDPVKINPNSVDVRLNPLLYKINPGRSPDGVLDLKSSPPYDDVQIPKYGLVLQPGTLYLGSLMEHIYSSHYIVSYDGRSTTARYGLTSHQTAGFCDLGWGGFLTLEISVIAPLRIYPHMRIGQVSFNKPRGEKSFYQGSYNNLKIFGSHPTLGRPNNI